MQCCKHLIAAVLGAILSQQYANASWDLTADWNPPANPNVAWSYGEISGAGGSFTALAWVPGNYPNAVGLYGSLSGAFVYQNSAATPYYGIAPGQISIESDFGSAAVQWTAPATGNYNIAVTMGGTTAWENGPGYGNNFAQYAGLDINGNIQTPSSFVNNVMSWDINGVALTAGAAVDAYVINPGYANCGNTETTFRVTAVPEPTTLVAGALLLLPFGFSTLRILRRKQTA